MSGYGFALALCAVVVGLLYFLLRTRRIQEKYAAVWILVAMAVAVLGAFPKLVFWLAALVGVGLPANLLFALAIVTLLAVSIQLSSELSSLEEDSHTLAEGRRSLSYDWSYGLRHDLPPRRTKCPMGPRLETCPHQRRIDGAACDQHRAQSRRGSIHGGARCPTSWSWMKMVKILIGSHHPPSHPPRHLHE